MRICYHGTNKEAAESILKEGFRAGTWFAANLQDALGFGGKHIFRVVFPFKEAPNWQFIADEVIFPDRITNYTIYQEEVIMNNEELRKKIFNFNIGNTNE